MSEIDSNKPSMQGSELNIGEYELEPQFGRQRGGIVAVYTKKENQIRDILRSETDITVVDSEMDYLKDILHKLHEKTIKRQELVKDNPEEFHELESYYLKIKDRFDLLHSDVLMWKAGRKRDINVKDDMNIRHISVNPDDSVSQISAASQQSVKTLMTKVAAKKAVLRVRAEALKKTQELKRRQMELEELQESLKLETDIAVVEAEELVYVESFGGGTLSADKHNELSHQIKQESQHKPERTDTLQQTVEHDNQPLNPNDNEASSEKMDQERLRHAALLNVIHEQEQQIRALQQHQTSVWTQPEFLPKPYTAVGHDNLDHVKKRGESDSHDSSEQFLSMQRQMLNILQLPKTELMTFDGDPLKYWMFVRSFENSFGDSCVNNSIKLNRLLQYCTGKALTVIECCAVMEPEVGYSEARRLLSERFGNQFVISKAWIQKVTERPCLKFGDSAELRRYADNVRSCVVTLTTMGRLNEIDNQMRMGKIVEKLPPFLQGRWRKEAVGVLKATGYYPDITHLAGFIETAAEEANDPVFGTINISRDDKLKTKKNSMGKFASNFNIQTKAGYRGSGWQTQFGRRKISDCKYCGDDHAIYTCTQFKQMSPEKRHEFVTEKHLCYNCFSNQHMSYNCLQPSKCGVDGCTRKHSRLLHFSGSRWTGAHEAKKKTQEISTQTTVQSLHNSVSKVNGAGMNRIALPIVPVVIQGSESKCIRTYALLDPGSTNTFCTQELVKQLGLQGSKTTLSLTTLTSDNSKSDTSMVTLNVADLSGMHCIKMHHVFVIPEIPVYGNSVASQTDLDKWPHLKDINLSELEGAKVDLLIGQDNPSALAPIDIRRGASDEPYAARTVLGWVVNGPLENGSYGAVTSHYVQAVQNDCELQSLVERFWKVDSCGMDSEVTMSVNDKRAINMWEQSVEIDNGHYKMDIPFKSDNPQLPNNYAIAEARLESLYKRFLKDKNLYERYQGGITELLEKGYAEKVPDDEIIAGGRPVWYIPHHAVVTPQKPDKLRIVFDCSAQCEGTSLNTEVLQGPDLTNKLIGVLLRFRQYRVAFMGDIEAMFHQVKVSEKHKDALRFLWWPNMDRTRPPKVYRMTVHLFGGVWSPSCASYAVRRTAENNADDFDQETVQTVLENLYVDDCLKSVPTEDKAIHLIKQLCELLAKGGFRMTKWVSNNRTVLDSIPCEERAKEMKNIDLTNDLLPQGRALGVKWSTENDTLGFRITCKSKPATKRGLISIIGSVYDPLGFICPVILKAKIIFQNECRLHKGWDEPLEQDNARKWYVWLEQLPMIETFLADRCLIPLEFENLKCDLHHFADASLVGYGTVSYLRIVNNEGHIHCAFVMGKSRLAPLKQLTVPRLELSAAVMAVRIDQLLRRELRLEIDQSMFWSDSMTVLHYIKNESLRYKTFVANRVSAIHSGSSPDSWRYIGSDINPADDASRGLDADEILHHDRWIQGPSFLWQEEHRWPVMPEILQVSESSLETKKAVECFVQLHTPVCVMDRLLERFSSWLKLKKATAWLLRFKQWLLQRTKGTKFDSNVSPPHLTVQELKTAEVELLKYLQRCHFHEEIDCLRRGEQVKKSSKLYKLEPVLNNVGVLCVGGRLSNAPIQEESKHPMIIPKNHHVGNLISSHFHEILGHSGREHVLSHMRQKLWLINARTTLNRILRKCVHCRRHQGIQSSQRMASLPKERVTPHNPPFTYVGVDCFGPFLVKRGRSLVKRYGCLFTCLTVRAIHIEKLDSMDTNSFINALIRFEARRGKPEIIRSDNGTNFKGAHQELRQAIQELDQTKIYNAMLERDIQWIFNPPTASHMGGVWERQIRTVRKVLSALLNKQNGLSDEGLNTLFCEAESIVNSRPITVVSDNVNDCEPLTPNHLLLLRSNISLPPGNFRSEDVYGRMWRHVQSLSNCFWKRWIKEYLPSLQLRQKWLKPCENMSVGDIVLVMEENTPRKMWPLARVTRTFPGKDGFVRSVEVKLRGSLLLRPIHKLCVLEHVE